MKVPGWVLSLFVFLTTQAVILTTLNPAFPNDDSAETITAGVTLGLQHPPSYALAALVDRLFSLLPLGSPAFRVNWGASLTASLSAAFLTWILYSFFEKGLFLSSPLKNNWITVSGAVLGGLAWAFSPVAWQNALSAKGGVYHLSLCFQWMLFIGLFLGAKEDRLKMILGMGFILGLGLTGHWETFCIILPAVLFVLIGFEKLSWSDWIKTICLGMVGLSPLLYLPLRARLSPVLNLGDPQGLSTFWADLSRSYFSQRENSLYQMFKSRAFDANYLNQTLHTQAVFVGNLLSDNLGLFWGFLALLGMALWFLSKDPKKFWFGAIFLGTILFAVFFLMTTESGNEKFLLPLNGLLFLWACLGLVWVGTEPKLRQGTLFLAMAAVILFMNVGASYSRVDQSRALLVHDYGEDLLKSLPSRSVFFAEADVDFFSLYYLQQVEHQRPDVVMIPAFTLFEPWGVEKVEKEEPFLGLTASKVSLPDHYARIIYASSEIVVKNRDLRPIAFSRFNGAFHRYYLDRQKDLKVRSLGLVWLLARTGTSSLPVFGPSEFRVRDAGEMFTQKDGSLESLRQIYYLAVAH